VLRLLSGGGRRAAVLGDMRELGAKSLDLHAEVGLRAASEGIDRLYTFGEVSSLAIREGALLGGMREDAIESFKDLDNPMAVAMALKTWLRDGDVLLIKASRALRAERILAELKRLYENP
jgi:UDP-N-acetylmuramoyl-tripeptide--D-alanyl-D-alanine ligase